MWLLTLPTEIRGSKPSSQTELLPSTRDLAQVIWSTWILVLNRRMKRRGGCRLKSCVGAKGGFMALTFCGRKNRLGVNSRILWETCWKMIPKLRKKRRQLLLRPKQTVKTTGYSELSVTFRLYFVWRSLSRGSCFTAWSSCKYVAGVKKVLLSSLLMRNQNLYLWKRCRPQK